MIWLSEESRAVLAEERAYEDWLEDSWPADQRDADQAQALFEWSQGMRP